MSSRWLRTRLAGQVLGCASLLAVMLVEGLVAPATAAAQPVSVRPWTPPSADSVVTWAAEARSRFQTAKGDSATGPNQRAYDLVGKIGRRLLLSIGRAQWIQAPAMDQVMDSLSLDTDVVVDPTLPDFVLLLVRNPYRPKAHAVGYLYWYKDLDLRYQGVVFTAVSSPRMRVWWTSRQQAPYEWGILSRERDPQGEWQLLLLRLSPDGLLWNLAQYENNGPALGSRGQAFWTDINGDERPEIVSWIRSPSDSGFTECPGCPSLVQELIFTERERGFELHDSRLLPTPYSSFMLFVRLLRDRNRAAAARLVEKPADVDAAIAAGWGSRAKGVTWSLEYAEPDQPWPRWLGMKLHSVAGDRRYVVHFTQREGRWIIRNWLQPGPAGKTPATQGARRP
jgi:hypothetical protein